MGFRPQCGNRLGKTAPMNDQPSFITNEPTGRCPFCGGPGKLDADLQEGYAGSIDDPDPDAYAYYVRCICCAATGGWAKSKSGAIRNWETRTTAEDAELERLRRVAKGWECQELYCYICGYNFPPVFDNRHDLYQTTDHIRPKSKDGLDVPSNKASVHQICNTIKADLDWPISTALVSRCRHFVGRHCGFYSTLRRKDEKPS